MRTIICALATAALLTLAVPAPSQAASRSTPHYDRDRPSCWNRDGRAAIARCFIHRAARRYDQSTRLALHIAHRESRFDWRATNASSGAAGLYQFMPRTWRSTPYRRYSPYHPKWASLAAMWMWKRGGYGHWAL